MQRLPTMAFCGWRPLSAAAAAELPRLPLLPRRHANFSVQAAPQRCTAARTGHEPATLGWVAPPRPAASTEGIRRPSRRSVICASLFGVGAPEALVIGVVALLVFGPKGLAEVARNLGKTLRAFQPTIRELQDVSREFRSTLEREIGIDEVPPSTNYRPTTTNYSQPPAVDPNVKPETTPYTSEELMKITEEQLAASAAAAWSPQPAAPSQQQESEVRSTSQSNDGAPSGRNDGPPPVAAAAAATEPDSSQVNQPKKADTRDEAA